MPCQSWTDPLEDGGAKIREVTRINHSLVDKIEDLKRSLDNHARMLCYLLTSLEKQNIKQTAFDGLNLKDKLEVELWWLNHQNYDSQRNGKK